MIPAEPEYLLNVVDEETYCKICEAMQGLRIYFPTSKQKAKNIIRDYEHMQKAKYTRNSIIDNLVGKYGLTKQTIKKRIRKYEEEKGERSNIVNHGFKWGKWTQWDKKYF